MRRVRSSRRVVAAVVAALLAGAVTTWATLPDDATPAEGFIQTPPPSNSSDRSPVPAVPLETPTPLIPQPARSTAPKAVPAPTRLEIASVRLRMPLTPVALDARGDMQLPPSPAVAGWYRYGPAPGSDAGAAVIAAHVDTPREGVGPLEVLDELEPGTEVIVRSGRLVTRYVIQSVREVEKGRLDLDALFARDGPHRLHIVTCGGEFDRRTRQYADNVVAVAVPMR